jgi:hypothetical protein
MKANQLASRRWLCVAIVPLVLSLSCTRGPSTARCPNEFSPSKLSRKQLEKHGIADIPESSATARENVRWAVEHRRSWIKDNYPGVVSVEIGPGWGVTYTNDQYGNTSYHHAKDYMVVAVVETLGDCPDPERGQLMVLDSENNRVPVRFEYLLKG